MMHQPGRRSAMWLIPLLLLVFMAAAARFYGLDWDGGIGAHPDERYLVGAAERLCWPHRLNPLAPDVAPELAYGHLPLYLLALARRAAGSLDGLLVARVLAALFDLGTVGMTGLLGWRIYGRRAGLLAAGLVAGMVLHIQQAHFYTADVPLAFFTVGSLVFAARWAEGGRLLDAVLAGVWAGLALGSKFSAALLALPLAAAGGIAPVDRGSRVRLGMWAGAGAVAAFGLTNPFALLMGPAFWRNLSQQAGILRGALDVAYTRQFHSAWPYLYPAVQQLKWGMGIPLGMAALGGLAYAVLRAVQEPPRPAEWVLLAWVVPGVAFVGGLYAKFPRYWLSYTPLLALYAARWLVDMDMDMDMDIDIDIDVEGRFWRARWGRWACGAVMAATLLHAGMFLTLYRAPHPWLVASAWFREHVAPGAVVAVEAWDHPLPLDAEAQGYRVRELPVFDEEGPEKWAAMERVLDEADYVVIASQRGYGTLARWPERYPLTTRYYERLFAGQAGFVPVACLGRYPRLGPAALADDPTAGLALALPSVCGPDAPLIIRLGRLDESFVVYDHPLVLIFRKQTL